MLKTILYVGFGGFIGSVLRYYVSKINLLTVSFFFPVGTFLANILGSLLLGFLVGLADKSFHLNDHMKLFLMVGVCGGFTTFSSFANENMSLLRNGHISMMALYTGLSLFFGIMAIYLGYYLAANIIKN